MDVQQKRGLSKTKMAKEASRGKVKPLWDVHGRGQGFSIFPMQGVWIFLEPLNIL